LEVGGFESARKHSKLGIQKYQRINEIMNEEGWKLKLKKFGGS